MGNVPLVGANLYSLNRTLYQRTVLHHQQTNPLRTNRQRKSFNSSDSTEVFCLWVKLVDDYSMQSLSMEQAAHQALQFAENDLTSEFYTPAFEELPL